MSRYLRHLDVESSPPYVNWSYSWRRSILGLPHVIKVKEYPRAIFYSFLIQYSSSTGKITSKVTYTRRAEEWVHSSIWPYFNLELPPGLRIWQIAAWDSWGMFLVSLFLPECRFWRWSAQWLQRFLSSIFGECIRFMHFLASDPLWVTFLDFALETQEMFTSHPLKTSRASQHIHGNCHVHMDRYWARTRIEDHSSLV